MIEKRLNILNGKTNGDWEDEYTYVRVRGSMVIDYAIVNEKIKNRIISFRVEDRVDSDHMSISIELEEEDSRKGRENEEERRNRKKEEMNIEEEQEERMICDWDRGKGKTKKIQRK